MFGAEHAEVYEVTYRGRGKDWEREAESVAEIILARRPGAASLLDVACGTGAHLARFGAYFPCVEGVEPAPAMRERAVRRVPAARIHAGDMRDFRLERTFDAVTCLFTAIAYLPTVDDMRAAVRSMAAHLVVGGVLVVEPWWLPEQFVDGYVGGDLVRDDGRVITRVSHTTLRERAAHMEVRWTVGDARGIHTFTEVEVFTLFASDEFLAAFRDAGCAVEHVPGWLTGRGLFIGVRER